MDIVSLVKSCQQGTGEDFEKLYRACIKKALGTAYLIAGNKGTAEDIVQEAFIKCFIGIKTLKTPETFEVWFYRTLVRTAWRMTSQKKYTLSLDNLGDSFDLNDEALSVENFFDLRERQIVIQKAISALSEPLKTVVILHYFNDLTVNEISSILGCLQGTVKSRLFNARRRIKKYLNKNFNIKDFDLNGGELNSYE